MYNNYNPYFNYGMNLRYPRNQIKINWKSLLNGTQRALNIVNQAIPLIYQIKPIYNNAKTIFRVMGSIKDDNTPKKESVNIINNNTNNNTPSHNNESPTFFL